MVARLCRLLPARTCSLARARTGRKNSFQMGARDQVPLRPRKSEKKLNSHILFKNSSWVLGSYKIIYYLCSGNESFSNVHGIGLWCRE